jgi:hypothetical protein
MLRRICDGCASLFVDLKRTLRSTNAQRRRHEGPFASRVPALALDPGVISQGWGRPAASDHEGYPEAS